MRVPLGSNYCCVGRIPGIPARACADAQQPRGLNVTQLPSHRLRHLAEHLLERRRFDHVQLKKKKRDDGRSIDSIVRGEPG